MHSNNSNSNVNMCTCLSDINEHVNRFKSRSLGIDNQEGRDVGSKSNSYPTKISKFLKTKLSCVIFDALFNLGIFRSKM